MGLSWGGAGSDKHRLHDKHGFPNNLGLHLVVDCYEEELVQKEVWDFMKKIPAAFRRMWIDGFINDGFIGIHALHPGAAVKSLSGEHYEGIARWKIVVKKNDTPGPDNFAAAKYVRICQR